MNRWYVADVMTVGAVSVREDTPFREVVEILETNRINAVPVTDAVGGVVGVVSSADLLPKIEYGTGHDRPRIFGSRQARLFRGKARATAAAELMTAPAITVMGTTALVIAAKTMDAQSLKHLPVVNDVGHLIGMVTRQDLLKVFLRPDADIHDEIMVDLSDGIPGVEPHQIRVEVDDGVVTLLGQLERRSLAPGVVRQIERTAGVVDVVSHLSYAFDDTGEPLLTWEGVRVR